MSLLFLILVLDSRWTRATHEVIAFESSFPSRRSAVVCLLFASNAFLCFAFSDETKVSMLPRLPSHNVPIQLCTIIIVRYQQSHTILYAYHTSIIIYREIVWKSCLGFRTRPTSGSSLLLYAREALEKVLSQFPTSPPSIASNKETVSWRPHYYQVKQLKRKLKWTFDCVGRYLDLLLVYRQVSSRYRCSQRHRTKKSFRWSEIRKTISMQPRCFGRTCLPCNSIINSLDNSIHWRNHNTTFILEQQHLPAKYPLLLMRHRLGLFQLSENRGWSLYVTRSAVKDQWTWHQEQFFVLDVHLSLMFRLCTWHHPVDMPCCFIIPMAPATW